MATALFTAAEVIDESLPGFSKVALEEVIAAACWQLSKKEKAPRRKLPAPLCVSAKVMMENVVPVLDKSSLRHIVKVARRLFDAQQPRRGAEKVHTQAFQLRQKNQSAGQADLDVFQLLAGMASECLSHDPMRTELDWDVWQLLAGMAKKPTTQEAHPMSCQETPPRSCQETPTYQAILAEPDWDVWHLLKGMAKESQEDWSVWNLLEGMAKEAVPVDSQSRAAQSPCAKKPPSTLNLPYAEEKTSLRHALRHSRLRHVTGTGQPAILLVATAFGGVSPKELAANILEMNVVQHAPATAFPKLPPAPKLSSRLSCDRQVRMLRQPGGRYGYVKAQHAIFEVHAALSCTLNQKGN
eukprot:CAMPEP_0197648922 /NCGR_PEP_ID=MMETSP1338-20131121/28041_1 /TAXON_ID=43686 ORGANISM="Pelagodinium beii, Strain RCC1491" /NCGR_SAMPLE_ID=MMETSP1338 /ASSEMBLY_ACC=CAM_ASM_000754 /LENGTH=353 /DNA_ID=CAMNT_0043222991 /DNA_START=51 /DNA_END=1110 /DNA_ORIENTATION=+